MNGYKLDSEPSFEEDSGVLGVKKELNCGSADVVEIEMGRPHQKFLMVMRLE